MAAVRFFVIGVPKAGTTALCQFLGQHPEVFMCPIKEPGFFAACELLALDVPAMRRSVDRKALAIERWLNGEARERPRDGITLHWDAYEALFDDVRDECAIGEGSTSYWWARRAPGAILTRFPDARLILILRHPADRFFSQYLATRWSQPNRTCGECFRMAREGREEWGAVLSLGHYATNLRRFFDCFPRCQFSIHLYEDFCTDPRAVCREIFHFLGVAPDVSVDVSARPNEPILPRWPILQALRQSLFGSFPISRLIPALARDLLRRPFQMPRAREAMDPTDRRNLIEYYRDEIVQTSAMIGRDLSRWLA